MATRTISNTGGNYNSTSTWVEGVVPTSADDVVATPTSGQLTVNVSSACKSINFTNYTNTLTMTNALSVSGNITLVAAMTVSGTGELICDTTATLTSNGLTIPNRLAFGAATFTLADAWTVGSLRLSGVGTGTINGFSISITGNLTSTTTSTFIGTTELILIGTGTWKNTSTGLLRLPLTINTSGTITISGNIYYANNFKYISGTVITAGSSLLAPASSTWDCSGMTWNNFNLQSGTQTLTSNINVGGAFSSSNPVVYNGADINLYGNMTIYQRMDGTSTFRYKGTGTWSASGPINNQFIIDTSGTLTIVGSVCAEKISHISGTVVTTGSTLLTNGNIGAMVYACSGITFNNVITAYGTITLNQQLNVAGTYTVGASNTVSIVGSAGFNVGSFVCTTAGRTISFKSGNTYTCDNLTLRGTNTSPILFKSSTSNAYTYFNLKSGGTCDVKFVNATDVDSSGGRLITDVKGTLLRTINWYKTNPDYFAYF